VDGRVLVEVHHPGVDARVTPGRPETRFAVTPAAPVRQATTRPGAAAGSAAWLDRIEDTGFRQVFAHIAAHGAVTEQEVTTLLGGARGVRRFAIQFDGLAERAPFRVRIDNVGGVKRYVREGGDR
jgi:hypothetical protein